jgi:hypothetical protein
MSVGCDTWRCWAELIANAFESVALLAAGWWFLYTTQFKPRIQFDIDCSITRLTVRAYLLEILLIFENKGFVEHRVYDLSLSVHALPVESVDGYHVPTKGRIFPTRLVPITVIVPEDYGFYFVRPGVRQVITHHVIVTNPGPIIEVTAGFTYHKRSDWPHTARRVFSVDKNLAVLNQEAERAQMTEGTEPRE